MRKTKELQIVLISGKKNSGKTAYLESIYRRALQKGWQAGGFLSKAEWENGQKTRYFLHNVQTGEKRLLAWHSPHPAPLNIGQYAMSIDTFRWGNDFVRQQLRLPVLLMDEFGPLEIQKKGWHDLLRFLVKNYRGLLFITVRPSLLRPLLHQIKKWRADVPDLNEREV